MVVACEISRSTHRDRRVRVDACFGFDGFDEFRHVKRMGSCGHCGNTRLYRDACGKGSIRSRPKRGHSFHLLELWKVSSKGYTGLSGLRQCAFVDHARVQFRCCSLSARITQPRKS